VHEFAHLDNRPVPSLDHDHHDHEGEDQDSASTGETAGSGCVRRSTLAAMSKDTANTRRLGHRWEPHGRFVSARLGWLRAGVLGANDGIVSIAGLVIGVAAAGAEARALATVGVAGLVAGAVSMALGEYVSVSTQRDTERALVAKERAELASNPHAELEELTGLLEVKGLAPATARTAAEELTEHDALASHLDVEIGLDQRELANPWAAAIASAGSFVVGGVLPLLAIVLPPTNVRISVAVASVLLALALTGMVSARLGGSPKARAVLRLVLGGALAMGVTYAVGQLLGVAVA
jgi:VIT1/CCC1 family predicted Fe2+/Mn2+ transporter